MTDNNPDTSNGDAEKSVIFESFPVGPLQCNCSIIGDPVSRKALIVDPGGDAELILEKLEAHQLVLVQIVHTHAHLDHILASGIIRAVSYTHLTLPTRFSV